MALGIQPAAGFFNKLVGVRGVRESVRGDQVAEQARAHFQHRVGPRGRKQIGALPHTPGHGLKHVPALLLVRVARLQRQGDSMFQLRGYLGGLSGDPGS